MKIIPLSDMLVAGVHCAQNEECEVSEKDGAAMIAQGFARRAPTRGAERIETEQASPVAETADKTPAYAHRKRG